MTENHEFFSAAAGAAATFWAITMAMFPLVSAFAPRANHMRPEAARMMLFNAFFVILTVSNLFLAGMLLSLAELLVGVVSRLIARATLFISVGVSIPIFFAIVIPRLTEIWLSLEYRRR